MQQQAAHGSQSPRNGCKELFSEADVVLQWETIRKPGCGLQNLGNTCFMNSVLQCLAHTPPLAELLTGQHSKAFRQPGQQNGTVAPGFNPLRMTQGLFAKLFSVRGCLPPVPQARSLQKICRGFRLGRQEDAHEYLVGLLDKMHEACLAGLQPKPPPAMALTSPIYRIFGGKMRSQVKCHGCGADSDTFEPFLDLSLDILRAATVTQALAQFTAGEPLEGANRYRCAREKSLQRATKRITVHQAPKVLVLQLKRFEYGAAGFKITRKVEYDAVLDLAPFMSERGRGPLPYSLYAVLVHAGHSLHSGHYYAFVKAPNAAWYCMDDSNVQQVGERMVLAQKAYILFYILRPAPGKSLKPAPAAATPLGSGQQCNGASHAWGGSPSPSAAPSMPSPQLPSGTPAGPYANGHAPRVSFGFGAAAGRANGPSPARPSGFIGAPPPPGASPDDGRGGFGNGGTDSEPAAPGTETDARAAAAGVAGPAPARDGGAVPAVGGGWRGTAAGAPGRPAGPGRHQLGSLAAAGSADGRPQHAPHAAAVNGHISLPSASQQLQLRPVTKKSRGALMQAMAVKSGVTDSLPPVRAAAAAPAGPLGSRRADGSSAALNGGKRPRPDGTPPGAATASAAAAAAHPARVGAEDGALQPGSGHGRQQTGSSRIAGEAGAVADASPRKRMRTGDCVRAPKPSGGTGETPGGRSTPAAAAGCAAAGAPSPAGGSLRREAAADEAGPASRVCPQQDEAVTAQPGPAAKRQKLSGSSPAGGSPPDSPRMGMAGARLGSGTAAQPASPAGGPPPMEPAVELRLRAGDGEAAPARTSSVGCKGHGSPSISPSLHGRSYRKAQIVLSLSSAMHKVTPDRHSPATGAGRQPSPTSSSETVPPAAPRAAAAPASRPTTAHNPAHLAHRASPLGPAPACLATAAAAATAAAHPLPPQQQQGRQQAAKAAEPRSCGTGRAVAAVSPGGRAAKMSANGPCSLDKGSSLPEGLAMLQEYGSPTSSDDSRHQQAGGGAQRVKAKLAGSGSGRR